MGSSFSVSATTVTTVTTVVKRFLSIINCLLGSFKLDLSINPVIKNYA